MWGPWFESHHRQFFFLLYSVLFCQSFQNRTGIDIKSGKKIIQIIKLARKWDMWPRQRSLGSNPTTSNSFFFWFFSRFLCNCNNTCKCVCVWVYECVSVWVCWSFSCDITLTRNEELLKSDRSVTRIIHVNYIITGYRN